MGVVVESLGELGLPEPLDALSRRRWDAIVVGGGHNGLTCAAYLARAGRSVLVLERRERVGGACTLERPFADPAFRVSPCAYVVGLLDARVIDELELRRRGLRIFLADPSTWAPVPGGAFATWDDDAKTEADLRALGIPGKDIEGLHAMERVYAEIREALRGGARDTWEGESPSRAEIEELLGPDQLRRDIVFSASIAEVLEHFIGDQRLRDVLFGEGIIGAYAGPRDWGTAGVKLMHQMGTTDGAPGEWGYVEGGMGTISFLIAEAAIDAGAVIATGTPVAEILPGEGVVLESGDRLHAPVVVSGAEPKRTMALVPGDAAPAAFRERIAAWKTRSPVVKYNAALDGMPAFPAAAPGVEPAKSLVPLSLGLDAAQEAFHACERGEARVTYGELYIQTGFDPTPAPEGKHLISVFGHWAPQTFASGTWDDHRAAVERQFIELLQLAAPEIERHIIHSEVLGPPDIEERIGLTGGHIFQGETMPDQMWEHRLASRTPVEGLYFCGAATHPAGSVIALNGRNAAQAVLVDLAAAPGAAR